MSAKKRKPMKRLPPDWGERLTLEDVDEILAHWHERAIHYAGGTMQDGLFTVVMPRQEDDLKVVRDRIVLWETVRKLKEAKERVMPLLNAALRG